MTDSDNKPQTDKTQVYLTAIRYILRPLVRGLISHGLTLPALIDILKDAYVREADHFHLEEKRLTDSRISLLTGVHRKDVKRLRAELDEDQDKRPGAESHQSVSAKVLALWLADERYTNPDGSPKKLKRLGENSFQSLVADVSRDVHSRTILDEWLHNKIVILQTSEGQAEPRVVLNVSAVFVSGDYRDKLGYFARNLHDHFAAATQNIQDDKPPLLEQSVSYKHLSSKTIEILHQRARELGMEALIALNKEARQFAEKDMEKPDADQRFKFGIYFYKEKEK